VYYTLKPEKGGKMIENVVKRSGEIEAYNRLKIQNALKKAFSAVGEKDSEIIETLTNRVEKLIEEMMEKKDIQNPFLQSRKYRI